MRAKMHLAACVPNDGARRLAWWLGEQGRDGHVALERAGFDANAIDRLLSGELLPGLAIGACLTLATGGAVVPGDFRRRARGWWFDRPSERPALRRAA